MSRPAHNRAFRQMGGSWFKAGAEISVFQPVPKAYVRDDAETNPSPSQRPFSNASGTLPSHCLFSSEASTAVDSVPCLVQLTCMRFLFVADDLEIGDCLLSWCRQGDLRMRPNFDSALFTTQRRTTQECLGNAAATSTHSKVQTAASSVIAKVGGVDIIASP